MLGLSLSNPRSVIVRLLGGLGNQFFQLSLGSILAQETNSKLYLDTSLLCDHSVGRHLVNRHSKLYILDQSYSEIDLHIRLRNNGFGCSAPLRAYSRILRELAPITTIRETEALDSIFTIITSIQDQYRLKSFVYLDGYWQYMKDYPQYETLIKKSLFVKPSILDCVIVAAKASDIDFETSVALHVRRSDYLHSSNQDHIIVLDPHYYQAANQRILSRINRPDISYYIFSDDLDWCRTNLSFLSSNLFFVDKPSDLMIDTDVYDFLLMTLFKFFVIPNSTFSLWSSYLSLHEGKYAIAPRQWFHGRNGPPLLNLGYAEFV